MMTKTKFGIFAGTKNVFNPINNNILVGYITYKSQPLKRFHVYPMVLKEVVCLPSSFFLF